MRERKNTAPAGEEVFIRSSGGKCLGRNVCVGFTYEVISTLQ